MKRWFTSKSSIGLVAVVAMLATFPAWAELKIGYVDFQRLAAESPQWKAAQESLRAEFIPRQRDIENQQAKLDAQADRLNKDRATMSDDEIQAVEKELRDGAADLNLKKNELQDDFNERRNEEMSRLQQTLINEVRAYAKEQNYDLIVPDAIYWTAALDITPAVIARLKSHSAPTSRHTH